MSNNPKIASLGTPIWMVDESDREEAGIKNPPSGNQYQNVDPQGETGWTRKKLLCYALRLAAIFLSLLMFITASYGLSEFFR